MKNIEDWVEMLEFDPMEENSMEAEIKKFMAPSVIEVINEMWAEIQRLRAGFRA